MSNKRYWPLVLWFQGVKGKSFRYVPSYAHHDGRKLPSFDTWEQAMCHAQKMLGSSDGSNNNAMALFRPWVVHQTPMPELTKPPAYNLLVTRIAVNQDGIIAPVEEGLFTQEK